MSEIYLLYSTFGSEQEALSAARVLVEKRLAACANVLGATSIYRWEGRLEQGAEAILFAKTTAAQLDAAIAAVKGLHSYKLPCIIACPVGAGFPPFLQWVQQETT